MENGKNEMTESNCGKKMNTSCYSACCLDIAGDIEWLKKQSEEDTPEKQHIISVLRGVVNYYYPEKRKITAQIIEILVLTQFSEWVEKSEGPYVSHTAVEAENLTQKAFDYYLGIHASRETPTPMAQIRFHELIRSQTGHIIKILEENGKL